MYQHFKKWHIFYSKGSVESLAQKAMTYSTSPEGLAAPILTPVSSTSIKVDWSPPNTPNGVLTNYSIYEGEYVHPIRKWFCYLYCCQVLFSV